MSTKYIKRWLSDFKALANSERIYYASTIRQNEELIEELYELFDNNDGFSPEVIDPVCHQLFDFYRSLIAELQLFTLEFVPTLIWGYLTALASNDKQRYGGIEACLLGIYNLDTVDEDGQPKVTSTTIPTLARGSIFHEPPSMSSVLLTESALMNCHSGTPVTITTGPLPQADSIIAQNRSSLLSYVVGRYNAYITCLSSRSQKTLCRLGSKLAKTGFDELVDFGSLTSVHHSATHRGVSFMENVRIPLSSGFFIELLSGVYYAMFNGQAREAIKAVDDIYFRAAYDLFPDVMLVTNAIRSSLQFSSGRPKDGPMGISVALSPAQGNPAFSKDAITNASFRAKKLPEDIEVPVETSQLDTSQHDESMESDSALHRGLETEKAKSSPVMKAGGKVPIKSIMKKDKAKHRKESDASGASVLATKKEKASHFKNDIKNDIHSSTKSPRHSASVSSGLAVTANVEPVELETLPLKMMSNVGGSNRVLFDPNEAGLKPASRNVVSNGVSIMGDAFTTNGCHGKPLLQPASHSRDLHSSVNGMCSTDGIFPDEEIVFTQL